ncbi:hypothetical protein DYU11_31170 [Fibrisoma montanum]|uniref:Uncharacterized protein n=1 Tax=Fibrisoma montanum TaxID=2305895 RepID=A0A418LWL8_9BACT|nr:hypothetical protein [Fibrisoma montanum]RIV17705.1 hypothetical protein DYU11_31170 [Fibrisoma montanum]
MTFEPTTQRMAIVLPMSFQKGDITFCSMPNGSDVRIPILPTGKPRHVVSTAQLTKGIWLARLNWSDGRQQYHDEKQITVN